jgi:hypothetical protein
LRRQATRIAHRTPTREGPERNEDTTMLDELTLATVLARHFPDASRTEIHDAAQDVLLLEILEGDAVGIAWEDRMQDANAAPVAVFACDRRLES